MHNYVSERDTVREQALTEYWRGLVARGVVPPPSPPPPLFDPSTWDQIGELMSRVHEPCSCGAKYERSFPQFHYAYCSKAAK